MSAVIAHATSPAFVRKHYKDADGNARQHVVGEVIGWQQVGDKWLPLVVNGGGVYAKPVGPGDTAGGDYFVVVFDEPEEDEA